MIYVSVMDPAAKDIDYSVGSLLLEASGDESPTTITKYLGAFSSVNLLHLTLVNDFGK